jgi:hypothetical protein
VPLLEDSAWQVRTDAARALSILAHTGIADELTRRLDEPDDGVLCFIILALGRTRDPASVPALARPGRNGTRTGNAGARGIFALALPGDNGASASCSAARPKAMSSDALPVFSTEPDAWAEASRRNRRLGQERVADRYWLAKQLPSGDWAVEQSVDTAKGKRRRSKLLDLLIELGIVVTGSSKISPCTARPDLPTRSPLTGSSAMRLVGKRWVMQLVFS